MPASSLLTMATVEIVVRTSGPWASMLVQMLREEGAQVDWTPPEEARSWQAAAQEVVVLMVAKGAYDGLKAAVARFRERTGGRASVETREVDRPPRHAKPED